MSDQYIVIPNWDEYQHYKGKERPRWIKLYPALLHDDQYMNLTVGEKATLFGIWLMYASSGRRVAADTASLTRQLGHRVTSQTLQTLNRAGFIEFSSRDGLETLYTQEKRIEENRDIPNPLLELPQTDAPSESRKNGWVDNLSSYTGCRLVRGEYAMTAKRDVLGKDRPPSDWPHERPSRKEILKALTEQAEGSAVA